MEWEVSLQPWACFLISQNTKFSLQAKNELALCISLYIFSTLLKEGMFTNMWSLLITPQSEVAFSSPRKIPNPRAFTFLFPALHAKLNKIKLITWLSVDPWWRAAVHQVTTHHPKKRWHLECAGVFMLCRNALSQLCRLAYPPPLSTMQKQQLRSQTRWGTPWLCSG